MTVQFQGTEYPIPQMRKFSLETDRSLREEAWRATAERYQQDRDELDEVFDKMIAVRDKIAKNAGFDNYRDYKFKEWHRFDYTPEDCKRFHEAVRTCLVPVLRQIQTRRIEQLGLEKMRPWDLSVDTLGREPLVPFDSTAEFIDALGKMFAQVDPEFGTGYNIMRDNGLLDLESRKGKAPGGYQCALQEARKPFIFMNAIGTNDDLRVLMHEGGHAFHALACADEVLAGYRHAPMEFCEVASMSMELLSASQLSVCYDDQQQARWWRDQLEKIAQLLISVACNDMFQHWLYENPTHTAQQRRDKWLEINERYSCGLVDWTGLEDVKASAWQRILHFYQVPFYYIEYGIAQLGALGVWLQSKEDFAQAVANYKKALALGGSRPLPELFETAGLEFDFSEKTIAPLSQAVLNEWQKYSA